MTRRAARCWQAGLALGAFGALEGLARAGLVASSVLPGPPSTILVTLGRGLASGEVLPHLATTFGRVFGAFGLAAGLGCLAGLGLWRIPAVVKSLEPLLASLYAVPWLALYPILLLVLGLGNGPIVTTATILGFVPVALNTYVGFAETRPVLLKVGLAHGCSAGQVLAKILLPAAAPYVVSGLRLGFLYAYLGVIGAEFLQSARGLGFLVSHTFFFFQDVAMYAHVLLVVLVTLALFFVLDHLERRLGRRYQ